MRILSIVTALVIAAASSKYTHESMPTPMAAAVDLFIFIIIYLIVNRSIKAYLDE